MTAFHFYEKLEVGVGSYCLDCLFSDIDSLLLFAGIHQIVYGYHRSLSKRFPFAIYYDVVGELIPVFTRYWIVAENGYVSCRTAISWKRQCGGYSDFTCGS